MRVSIESVPLVVQPADEDIRGFRARAKSEIVRRLGLTAEEQSGGIERFEVVVDGWLFEVATEPARRAELRERVARQAAEHQQSARLTLRAQIPGRVVRVWVAQGDKVDRGQRLLAVEAMKMENEIRAPQAGVVEDIRVEVGARVEREDELLSLG